MKSKIIVALLLVVSMILLSGCTNPFLPVYEYEETDENGVSVIVQGVRYTELLPPHKWLPGGVTRCIGYAGSRDILVFATPMDTDLNFLFLQRGFYSSVFNHVLFRADKDMPDVSADSIDKMQWYEHSYESEDYINTIEDKEIIREFCEALNTGQRMEDAYSIIKDSKELMITIIFYCSDLPGASYHLYIMLGKDKMVCGTSAYKDTYVEMPEELLMKISGRDEDFFMSLSKRGY